MSIIVLGSGVVGLRTAVALRRAGRHVVVRSSHNPTSTATPSPGAGGLWYPFHCNDPRVSPWAATTLQEYHDLHGQGHKAVELVPALLLKSEATRPPPWTRNELLRFKEWRVDDLMGQKDSAMSRYHIPGFASRYEVAWTFETPVVDAPALLLDMLRFLERSGVDVDTKTHFRSSADVVRFAAETNAQAIVNCTGSGVLTGDDSLSPSRGILRYYRRPRHFNTCILVEDPPVASEAYPVYAIPRGNLVAVGGSCLEGDSEPSMRATEQERLQRNASLLLPEECALDMVGEWVGFRPERPAGVAFGINEKLSTPRTKWIDNYGHGGSGWTVVTGCARDIVKLVC